MNADRSQIGKAAGEFHRVVTGDATKSFGQFDAHHARERTAGGKQQHAPFAGTHIDERKTPGTVCDQIDKMLGDAGRSSIVGGCRLRPLLVHTQIWHMDRSTRVDAERAIELRLGSASTCLARERIGDVLPDERGQLPGRRRCRASFCRGDCSIWSSIEISGELNRLRINALAFHLSSRS